MLISQPEQQHARLGPSGAYWWMQCQWGIQMQDKQIPGMSEPTSNPAADAGTCMHEVFERVLNGGDHLRPEEIEYLDTLDFGEKYCRKIIDQGVEAAQKTMRQFRTREFVTETRVNPGARIGRNDLWGTADLIAANERKRILVVGDLKTGRIKVDARRNKQMMIYALGALEEITFEPRDIILSIFQPPHYGNRAKHWATSIDVLHDFEKKVAHAAALTNNPRVQPNPSEEACRYCPVKKICPAHLG